MLMIKLTSVMVDDQAKALAFYTDVLGFVTVMDFPVGEYRWITVAARDRDDLQLALEPNVHGKAWQAELFAKRKRTERRSRSVKSRGLLMAPLKLQWPARGSLSRGRYSSPLPKEWPTT